ncbi:UPF0345 protein [Propionigenium maris DSM 9537]|uniref:Pyrimidine/purine nucleoside phosphorylase n=1 Tax=Propionigenium maris DSM 9537 TaxID=1123000 RepID=A0A9W6LLQ1_9FUSO|nr:pyrimidine/purine nucleoside phosphorylase [Propionigenium maris]GLI54902.1 UPF0345 protein [Propionigenium maris DSM 9537]
MFKTNEYFEGRVKSLSFENNEGPATIGVMAPGEYEFGTSKKEYMTVTCGRMEIKLPEAKEWIEVEAGKIFEVEANRSFNVRVEEETSYLCLYR